MTFELDPMTLILKLDLDIVKMYHHTKNEVSMSTASKVIAQTDTHTHNENITYTAYAGGKDTLYSKYYWPNCSTYDDGNKFDH